MNPEIKPLPTHFMGYAMRSRNEARWAHVFQHGGLTWEYEPEGYPVPGLGGYRPDFLLSDGGHTAPIWCEIKRNENLRATELWVAFRKLEEMTRVHRLRGLLIAGNPWPGECALWVTPVDGGILLADLEGAFGASMDVLWPLFRAARAENFDSWGERKEGRR